MPGDHKSIARIVAFATDDDHGSVDTQPLERIDDPAAGILHQHESGEPVLVDCQPIDLSRFVT